MIRILHAADFHLDSAFSSLPPEKAASRRREQRAALEQLAALCEGCDLVLLSGDLFDSARVYRDTLDALKRFFAAVSAEIFIAPGNHDYLTQGSPYLTEDWGERVHIFTSNTVERVRLDACDVYGAGFTAQEMPPMLDGFRVNDPDRLNLMVLHGDLQPNSVYNYISAEAVAASGLDYLALGHVHKGEVRQFGKTVCAWPGCLMGRGFDECGEKGVYKVTLDKSACKTEFLPLRTRKYEILSVDAGDDPLAAIRAALPAQTGDDCYRILLTGESDAVDLPALERALAPRFYSLSVRDCTVPKQALWAAAGDDTLRGHFLRDLKEQYDTADEGQRRRIAAAAKLVTALMDGREVSL
ncbi:MAG: DNA repair exonuclease [Oscillospiraceae bacterium]|nr:DNA repair exonuclease [Oscillospiraceae bacterium]